MRKMDFQNTYDAGVNYGLITVNILSIKYLPFEMLWCFLLFTGFDELCRRLLVCDYGISYDFRGNIRELDIKKYLC